VHSLDDMGWNPFFDRQVTDEERARWTPARVVWEARERYRLSTGDAEWHGLLTGRIRHAAGSRADLPVVGDWVLAAVRPAEQSATIHRRLGRRSRFSRAAAGRPTEEEMAAVSQGVPVLVTSALRGDGIADLHEMIRTSGIDGAPRVVRGRKVDADQRDRRRQPAGSHAGSRRGR
jgi:ribosome biogenesis GTPase